MNSLEKLFNEVESTFQIVKVHIVALHKENRFLKKQIEKLKEDLDNIIKSQNAVFDE